MTKLKIYNVNLKLYTIYIVSLFQLYNYTCKAVQMHFDFYSWLVYIMNKAFLSRLSVGLVPSSCTTSTSHSIYNKYRVQYSSRFQCSYHNNTVLIKQIPLFDTALVMTKKHKISIQNL